VSITFGYIGGPPATGVAIQVAPVGGVYPGGMPCSVVLGQAYWPVDIGGVLGPRPSFDGQPVPFMLRQGTCITVSKAEAAALLAAGVAGGA
jgi:hypothetical protein